MSLAAGRPAAADDWALPKAPDPASLTQAYPACDGKQVMASLRKCASDLEFFNSTALEGYNRANAVYVRALHRYDARLEKARAGGTLTADRVSVLHDDLKDALDDATLPGGGFLATYNAWLQRYRDQAKQVRQEIIVCTLSPACPL